MSGTGKVERVPTGIARLDDILQGGLLRGRVYTVTGPPGSGKTILASQLCFHHIARGGRCVYVTLLVESHAKMLDHLATLGFFRAEAVPERLFLVSAYAALQAEGGKGLVELARRTLRDRDATLLVVDGMESLEALAGSPRAYREAIHELQGAAGLLGATTLLLSNSVTARDVESSIVDGVIELSDRLVGPRAVRELTVRKLRGSDHLRGRHEVEITSRGLVVHPRTEVQFHDPAPEAEEARERMPFGVARLDEMMGGGAPSGSATALVGAPGTGKTLLGLSFLAEGARRGQRGTYFGFYEPPPRLLEKAAAVGIPLEEHVRAGRVRLVWQPPLEHMMD
jgi:circadian clock protein KaiC